MRGGEPPLLTREGVPSPQTPLPSPSAFCLKSCANRQGSLSARQQKALPAYADSAFPYSYEYHLVPALALKDSFLHSLFYRAFHTVLCLLRISVSPFPALQERDRNPDQKGIWSATAFCTLKNLFGKLPRYQQRPHCCCAEPQRPKIPDKKIRSIQSHHHKKSPSPLKRAGEGGGNLRGGGTPLALAATGWRPLGPCPLRRRKLRASTAEMRGSPPSAKQHGHAAVTYAGRPDRVPKP